jgi:branched-subunit amino acid aminotransferase/4-amino-4-deoxychorismate lyase
MLCCVALCAVPSSQANKAGVDEGLMLDTQGFVATCNSVNFFIVREGEVRRRAGGQIAVTCYVQCILRSASILVCCEHSVCSAPGCWH